MEHSSGPCKVTSMLKRSSRCFVFETWSHKVLNGLKFVMKDDFELSSCSLASASSGLELQNCTTTPTLPQSLFKKFP